MVEMNKNNLFWCCPKCQALNRWENEACTECLHSFDKALAKATVSVELRELCAGYRPVVTKNGTFYFKKIKNRKHERSYTNNR